LAAKYSAVINPATKAEQRGNEQIKSFFFDAERKRTDKQIGASPGSSGTTSLAVKGGTPSILGWAVESGAATSSISGNTVTIRINPAGFAKAFFYRQGLYEIRDVVTNDTFENILHKFSFGLSFDVTRGTETPVFTGSERQLSAFSARYEFINNRNPLNKHNRAKREELFQGQTGNLNKIVDALENLENSQALVKLLSDTNAELDKIPIDLDSAVRLELARDVIEKRMENFSLNELLSEKGADGNDIGKTFRDSLVGFTEGSIGFKAARDNFIEEINRGTVVTFEYTNNREVTAPDTSNFRFIWEKGVFGNADFTFNASLTMFNKKPAAMDIKRIKDFAFTLQLDVPLKNRFLLSDSTLAFSVKYLRQPGNVVLPNGFVADGTKGDIAFGQAKLTIPFGDTGIKFPISFTFANRNEFVRESFARANFGLTFDFDRLFRSANPFGSIFP
jgi:hypothetical protein